MEAKLKSALGLSFVKSKGSKGGGCISEGKVFETENGDIFVKVNTEAKADVMFEGELEGLKTIQKTNTVRVPAPIKDVIFPRIGFLLLFFVFRNIFFLWIVVDLKSSGKCLVMEYIEMSGLSKYAEQLGEQLAKMHLFNINLQASSSSTNKSIEDDEQLLYVAKFGFHTTTCCGYIPQENSWKDNWVEFYAQQRLDHQIKLLTASYGDRELTELWSELSLKIPSFFEGLEIKPSLLHGDLWSGNAAETKTEPVIFDCATFYGHSEYELSIADMFGGFPRSFYNAYHNILPKEANFDKRKDLYKLFHCLNHWNHFGGGYRSSSLSIMRRLLKNE